MANNVRDFTVNSLQQFYNKLNNDILPTYASMSYVESAYAYIINEIVDNEYVIAQTFNSHNDRITALENADTPTGTLTGVNLNGNAVTVNNGIAEINTKYSVTINTSWDYITDGEEHIVTADHYYNDIHTAINDGKTPYVIFNGGMIIPYIGIITESQIIEFGTTVNQLSIYISIEINTAKYRASRALISETLADWDETDNSSYSYILNKPIIPSTLDDILDGNTRKLSDYLPLSGGTMNNDASINIPGIVGGTELASNYIHIKGTDTDSVCSDIGQNYLILRDNGPVSLLYANSLTFSASDSDSDNFIGTQYKNGEIVKKISNDIRYSLTFPNKTGTFALTSDIPSTAGLATESYVNNKVAGIVNSAPETLDTLNELAAALGNDANFSTTVATQIGERVSKTELAGLGYVTQTTLSAQGYLTTETKANWNETNSNSAAYIQNKPELIWEKGNGAYSVLLPASSNYDENYAYGEQSVAHGSHVTAYGNYSHAEGINTFAGKNIILHEIWDIATEAEANHSEGLNTVAWGGGAHAEGDSTYTKGIASHAEGIYTYAYGSGSHAEGYKTISYAASSHAEGRGSYSAGEYSHAEGNYTNTYNTYEHAEGVANVSIKHSNTFGDSENTQFTIGIGEVKYPGNNTAYPPNVINRKNAISVMQNGYAYFLNVGNYDGTNLTSAKPLHTVLNEISSNSSSTVTESTVSGWGFTKNAGTLTGVKFNNTNATINGTVAEITATIPSAVTESTVSDWGFTKNAGTITGITMNGSSKGTSGVVDLGTVLTAHQDISGKQDTITDLATIRSNASAGAAKVSANNSTITIQKGGTNVDTFTTNAASNKTINIPNELPTYSSSDAGKVLSINSSGQLVWITPVSIYTGSGDPSNSMGNDGDIYLQS